MLKVRGSNSCGRGVEGSGFLYKPGHLMTNAHVVAGVRHPEVLLGEDSVPAEVVYYNANRDVAVLSCDRGRAHAGVRPGARRRDGVASSASPSTGRTTWRPAGSVPAATRSPNIYGNGPVIREVYSLRGLMRPGNSGGPIVSSAGDVVGMVFATSVADEETGYALTAGQVARARPSGWTATPSVDRRLRQVKVVRLKGVYTPS